MTRNSPLSHYLLLLPLLAACERRGGGQATDDPLGVCAAEALPPRQLRLLTRREYNAAVAELLGGAGAVCALDTDCEVLSQSCVGGTCQDDPCTRVTFTFDPGATSWSSVTVAGTFNGWDPAAGTANLTRDYNDWGCLISSTAERPDVQVMAEQGWGGKRVFQYDFLNPGSDSPFFDADGVKNLIPDKVDDMLRAAARAGKRLVFLMNPPYGTANSIETFKSSHKAGMALTRANEEMNAAKLGAPSQQLYAQFMYRCSVVAREYGFKDSTVALFSVPTFMSSGSYRPFRDWWYGHRAFKGGFLFQASHFADVSGRWGISFTVWDTGTTDKTADLRIVLKDECDFSVVSTRNKVVYNSDYREASEWVREPIKGIKGLDVPQMSSGLSVVEKGQSTAFPGSLAYMTCNGNNLVEANDSTYIVSGGSSRGHGVCQTYGNWRRAVALYGARKLVLETWDTQKDEYLRPDEKAQGYEQWVDDTHIFTLVHRFNQATAMRDVTYKGKSWRIKNHWFWRTRKDVLKALDTKDTPTLYRDCKAEPVKARDTDDVLGNLVGAAKWEQTGDAYFAHVLPAFNLSPDARKVLDLLDALWVKSLPVRESYAAGKPELHLTAYDAGVYQLKHLWRDLFPEDWKALQDAFHALEDRLRDGVYEYGFLRR